MIDCINADGSIDPDVEEFQCLNVRLPGLNMMFKFDPAKPGAAKASLDGGATWMDASAIDKAMGAFKDRHPFAMEN